MSVDCVLLHRVYKSLSSLFTPTALSVCGKVLRDLFWKKLRTLFGQMRGARGGVGLHVALTVQSPDVTTYITWFEIKKAWIRMVLTVNTH